jgi:hypothetical protein
MQFSVMANTVYFDNNVNKYDGERGNKENKFGKNS